MKGLRPAASVPINVDVTKPTRHRYRKYCQWGVLVPELSLLLPFLKQKLMSVLYVVDLAAGQPIKGSVLQVHKCYSSSD